MPEYCAYLRVIRENYSLGLKFFLYIFYLEQVPNVYDRDATMPRLSYRPRFNKSFEDESLENEDKSERGYINVVSEQDASSVASIGSRGSIATNAPA